MSFYKCMLCGSMRKVSDVLVGKTEMDGREYQIAIVCADHPGAEHAANDLRERCAAVAGHGGYLRKRDGAHVYLRDYDYDVDAWTAAASGG